MDMAALEKRIKMMSQQKIRLDILTELNPVLDQLKSTF